MDEFDLIDRLIAPLAAAEPGTFGLANDAAVFALAPGCEVVGKLLRTNLSDLAAMGARARGYLLGLGLDGRRDEAWLAAFFDGLRLDQGLFGITLLGGDTITVRGGTLTLSLTAIGEVPQGRALTRSGAADGDLVCVSGTVGDGALGLLVRRGDLQGLPAGDRAALEARYRLPEPRLDLGRALPGIASAALDVSDGLLADAGHIARRSGLRLRLDWPQVPLSPAGRRALETDADLLATIATGGDDYELLFTLPPVRQAAAFAAAAASGTALAVIGRCEAGQGVVLHDALGADITPAERGWRHG